jgi:glucokinase
MRHPDACSVAVEYRGEVYGSFPALAAPQQIVQGMRVAGELVGRAAASVCNALDLSLVVVGGSVALGFAATFFHSAQNALDEHTCLPYSRGARITPTRLGDVGPLVGAGAVGWRGLRRSITARREDARHVADQPPNER